MKVLFYIFRIDTLCRPRWNTSMHSKNEKNYWKELCQICNSKHSRPLIINYSYDSFSTDWHRNLTRRKLFIRRKEKRKWSVKVRNHSIAKFSDIFFKCRFVTGTRPCVCVSANIYWDVWSKKWIKGTTTMTYSLHLYIGSVHCVSYLRVLIDSIFVFVLIITHLMVNGPPFV